MLENLRNKLELYRTDYHNVKLMIKSTSNTEKKKQLEIQLNKLEVRWKSCKRCIEFLENKIPLWDLHELEVPYMLDYIFGK